MYTSSLAESLAEDLLDRFLRYVRIDTQSARDRTQSPSTPGQLDLSGMLVDELLEIGLTDAALGGLVGGGVGGDRPRGRRGGQQRLRPAPPPGDEGGGAASDRADRAR